MTDILSPTTEEPQILRVATYNIHKGVQGLGPARRLEIHNLGLAVEQLDADIVCLQEVRKMNRKEEQYFDHWPNVPQAEYLAPEGYESVYLTNAYTKDGEHGNALLSRWPVIGYQHEDISDHRFEQRGLLHVELDINGKRVHSIVVHLGLIPGSRCGCWRRAGGRYGGFNCGWALAEFSFALQQAELQLKPLQAGAQLFKLVERQ